jgi:hypothetical protein
MGPPPHHLERPQPAPVHVPTGRPGTSPSVIPPQQVVEQLDRLAAALTSVGWRARVCVREGPRLLVYVRQGDSPCLTVTVLPHPLTDDPNAPWYRLSTGPLVRCSNLDEATATINEALCALEASGRAPSTPRRAEAGQVIRELKRQGVAAWHGCATNSWWAMVPDAVAPKLSARHGRRHEGPSGDETVPGSGK